LVGWGVADLFLAGLGDPDPLFALPAGLPLSLDPDLDLLLGGGEGDIFFLGASIPSPPAPDSCMSFLTTGLIPVSRSLSGFRGPGLPPLASLLDFFLFFFLSSLSLSLLLLESELESLLDSLELSLLELELELLAFLLFFCPLSPLFSLLLPFLFSLSSSLLSDELPPLPLLAFSGFSLGCASCSLGGCLSLSSPGGSTPPPVPMLFK